MKNSTNESSSNKTWLIIGGAIIVVVLLLLGWKITDVSLFGIIKLEPPSSQNQNPPSAPNPSVGQTTVECIHPQVLAQQKGWTDKGATGDIYGGWYVELINSDQLPNMWEALGQKHIYQTDSDRSLTPGRWAIYTPFACRDQFGFSH